MITFDTHDYYVYTVHNFCLLDVLTLAIAVGITLLQNSVNY